ncbi:XRE family transcriptional regulator [Brevundimonas sp. LPMIX5]|nr:XRE family transcriptional regulator [Brevundimonas sp. LPMIX5]
MGEALAALRRDCGLSQAEAGARIGMTGQGWGLYEAGKRPGLFRPDVQRRLTGALDATPEALVLQSQDDPAVSRQPRRPESSPEVAAPQGLSARGRAFEDVPAQARRLRLETDELAPWASAGTVLEYVLGRWPRRGQGCVIQMEDGVRKVRLYDRADDAEVVVLGAGALDQSERIARSRIQSMSAVTSRLDDE